MTTRDLILSLWRTGEYDTGSIAVLVGKPEPEVCAEIHADQDRRHAQQQARVAR